VPGKSDAQQDFRTQIPNQSELVLAAKNILPSQYELEELLVNNDEMALLSSFLKRFNPIKAMRTERKERLHSAMLAWLLDPLETHELNDRFLRAFLCEAMRGESSRGSPTAFDILNADLRDTVVRLEWKNIDVLVFVPSRKWAFIIENKFESKQHSDQLSRYVQTVTSAFEPHYEGLIIRGVFLTLEEEPPKDKRYVSIRYSMVCGILPRILSDAADTTPDEVRSFINHYLQVIREAAGMSDERKEMERLARQIYVKHRKLFDFVIEHGTTTEFGIALEKVFGGNLKEGAEIEFGDQRFKLVRRNTKQFFFLPSIWIDALGGDSYSWPGCRAWFAGYPLICWLQAYGDEGEDSGRMRLFAEVGPLSPPDARKSLIAQIESVKHKNGLERRLGFQRGANEDNRRYSRFLRQNGAEIADMRDPESIEQAIRTLLGRFQPVFEAVEHVLAENRSASQPN